MNSVEAPMRCISCEFERGWPEVIRAIRSERVLESDNPRLALARELGINRMCCRQIIFGHRVDRALREALWNKHFIDRYREERGDEQKFTYEGNFPDIQF